MHELDEVHDTAFSALILVPLFGLAATDQPLPFHDSISVWKRVLAE